MRRTVETIDAHACCSVRARCAERLFRPVGLCLASELKTVTALPSLEALTRENAYLRQRNAQLQGDVAALGAQAERLRQIVERLYGRTSVLSPDLPSRSQTP
jgi:hypothetical protein